MINKDLITTKNPPNHQDFEINVHNFAQLHVYKK